MPLIGRRFVETPGVTPGFLMRDTLTRFLLALALLLTAAAYSLGLQGDFLFDDYPQIVLNKALFPFESYADLLRIWNSGNTGPGGRPIPVLSFAVQIALTGLDPFYFKLVNLGVHLLNGVLIYFLSKQVCLVLDRDIPVLTPYRKYLPVLLSAWWLLSPMALGAVLYAVQRMTSLGATFSLLGLLWYCHFRARGDALGLLIAGAGLLAFTISSYYSKEIGALTLVYAYLLELVVFRWRSGQVACSRILAVLKHAPLFALAYAGFWLWKFYDFEAAYAIRAFTLGERVLTQARVVWFYIVQIFVPNVSLLTFHHDDFVISKGLLNPLSTIFALLGHALMLFLALRLFTTARLVSFGVFWFYGGHLLESTVFPLEMIFEHRNYLPMLGLYVAVLSLPFYFGPVQRHFKLFLTVVLLLIAGAAFATAVRATDWGSPMRALIEAEHKPGSSRANYEAGAKLLGYLRENPKDLQALARARGYFQRAVSADVNDVASFVGLIELSVLEADQVDPGLLRSYEDRLTTAKIHPAVAFTIAQLDRLASMGGAHFDEMSAQRLYRTMLANPSLTKESQGHALTALARSLGRGGDYQGKNKLLKEAITVAPNIFEFHLLYIESLLEIGDIAGAKLAMNHYQLLDKYGYYAAQVEAFHQHVSELESE